MVTVFYELGKNKVCQIKMFAKQKSCTIIDVEKGFFFHGCQMPQKKVISADKVPSTLTDEGNNSNANGVYSLIRDTSYLEHDMGL